MTVFLTTLGLIGAAEMGDKTQLLTLALAARFPLGAVLGGVVVATLLNHALAVALGGAALLVVPANVLRAVAGLSFIGFGLWTLRGDRLAGNEERRVGPPLVTVVVSFFLAEMGDKTQLATAVLAAQATNLLPVWLGSVLGMILADGLAVAVGYLLGRRLPERPLKIGAAALFLLFGLLLLGARPGRTHRHGTSRPRSGEVGVSSSRSTARPVDDNSRRRSVLSFGRVRLPSVMSCCTRH